MHEWFMLARKLVAAHHAKREELDKEHGETIAEFEKRELVADHVAAILKTENEEGRISRGNVEEVDHTTFVPPPY